MEILIRVIGTVLLVVSASMVVGWALALIKETVAP